MTRKQLIFEIFLNQRVSVWIVLGACLNTIWMVKGDWLAVICTTIGFIVATALAETVFYR